MGHPVYTLKAIKSALKRHETIKISHIDLKKTQKKL